MDKTPIGFWMTPEIGEKFFRLCIEREATTNEERIAILRELQLKEATLGELQGKKVLLVIKRKKNRRNHGPENSL